MSELQNRINAKRALLRVLDKELEPLIGHLLPKGSEQELRLRSIHEEQDRLEHELRELGVEP
jgi:hypothetical protein